MITLKDVAQESGVSPATVSQVFGKRSHLFSQEVREKVFQAAERLGYRKNTGAVSLVTGKTNTICIVHSELWNLASSVYSDLFFGLSKSGAAFKQQISFLCLPSEDFFKSPEYKRLLMEQFCDGVIFNTVFSEEECCRVESDLKKVSLPMLWLNRKIKFNSIYPDEESAANSLAEKLRKNGHEKILYVGVERATHYSAEVRHLALKETFLKMGGKQFLAIDRWETQGNLLNLLKAFFHAPQGTTAVALYADSLIPQMFQTAGECGVFFSRRYSWAVFDAPVHRLGRSGRLSYDAAAPSMLELGSAALERILERIQLGGQDLPSLTIPPTIHNGNSIENINRKGACHADSPEK